MDIASEEIMLLNKIDRNDARAFGGGKCAGLKEVERLVDTYSAMHYVNVEIPETYVIPLSFYDQYNDKGCVPEELVTAAMECVVALGGNVAVRSSADVEDSEEESHSGHFASVLNVKTRAQMRDALNKVYSSAQNVAGARMGVLIQPMIGSPLMAGVAYSEAWNKAPFVVMNYTKGETADKLITHGGNKGDLFAVGKDVKFWDCVKRLSFSNLRNQDTEIGYINKSERSELKIASGADLKTYEKQFALAALISGFEKHLGYPVDVEFAFSKDGTLYILQQRPYISPDLKIERIDKDIETSYTPLMTSVSGYVSYDSPEGYYHKDNMIFIDKDDDCVSFFTGKSCSDMEFSFMHSDPFNRGGAYNHLGNMERESLDFRSMWVFHNPQKFDDIKEGDYITIDLLTGKITKGQPQGNKTKVSTNVAGRQNDKSY